MLAVHVKHSGKLHSVQLDTNAPATAFKEAIYALTGVPPDRMKVMVKGGVLKDDADWKRVAPKAGQTFMVIGAAGELPKPPEQPVVFLEDLGDTELAEALRMPVGLQNLGNTCYMNATVQCMRAIPELQTALRAYRPAATTVSTDEQARLAVAMRDMYGGMSSTTDDYTPRVFLFMLRQRVPQFAEHTQAHGYAQQDAEECWTQIVQNLTVLPPVPGPGDTAPGGAAKFVEQFMMGEMTKELKCIEAPDEPPTVRTEKFSKLDCNITISTNYMAAGIADSLDGVIEKDSPSLARAAQYTVRSRIARLPAHLVVHMVRFAWRRDINKKAKIMRRVRFPFELDAAPWCTDELQARMRPLAQLMQTVDRERRERAKVRARTKTAAAAATAAAATGTAATTDADVAMADAPPATVPADGAAGDASALLPGELEDEDVARAREGASLRALADAGLVADTGASPSGLYELCAIVTHKGAGADSGHYIGFVRRDALDEGAAARAGADDEWYKFDDTRVSIVPQEKIVALEGGGEDSVAYILLYRTKKLV